MKHFEKLRQQWIALNDLERTVPEKIDERATRDMDRKPWNDEDAWGLVVSGQHMQVRMARIEQRQQVLFAAIMKAQEYSELSRGLIIALITAVFLSYLFSR